MKKKKKNRKCDREPRRRCEGIERCGKRAENERSDPPGPADKPNFDGWLLLYGEIDVTCDDKKVLQDEIVNRLNQNRDCANAALAYYNEQNPDVEFKLVDPLYSCAFEIDNESRWYHLNFVAKPESASPKDYSSFKLFFAELNYRDGVEVVDGRNRICKCCIVDPDTCSGVTVGCGWCDLGYEIYHPIGSFRVGNKYDPLDSFCPGDYHPVGIFREPYREISLEDRLKYSLEKKLDRRLGF